jgi:hypothetical protein
LAIQPKTPGVFIQERDAFPASIVGVETAAPVFIGYTETAEQSGRPVHLQPVRISSLRDYEATFGGPFVHPFRLTALSTTTVGGKREVKLGGKIYRLDPVKQFYLYNGLRLFFANGGGPCYVVSVGTYDAARVLQADLAAGLTAVHDLVGPTLLVIPELVLLYDPSLPADNDADCRAVAETMLQQCADRADRFALLDVWGAEAGMPVDTQIDRFRGGFAGVAPNARSYGAAYFPFLTTSLVDPANTKEVSYTTLDAASLAILRAALPGAALDANNPTVKNLHAVMAEAIGTLPPSAAMAGIYAMNDAMRGVWSAPANVGFNDVRGPIIPISDATQDDLNVPLDGLAVNTIRDFVGRGTLVWGARTLDGNDNDLRYIQVRRTLIYIGQSIKLSLEAFAFEPNVAQTWTAVMATINGFLRQIWQASGLMGAKPQDAFAVLCGLGSTMTAQDVADGNMNVRVSLSMIRPAEFIQLTFTQKVVGEAG